MTAKAKRGYSREFPTNQRTRKRITVDWVPPALKRAAEAKAKRAGTSLRAKILGDLQAWVDEPDEHKDMRERNTGI